MRDDAGYVDSVDFWGRWAAVPLDLAVTLTLGHDPEEFDGYGSSNFVLLKALAFDHATAGEVDFKAPNNSSSWRDDPTVYLKKFAAWARGIGYELRPALESLIGETSPPAEKPMSTRERNTLLTIIAALCKEANIDHTKPAKAAGLIQGAAASMGVSIGETTIEGHLKKIPDALATRTK